MPQISVIIAVYAAEKYLKKCLDSLLVQTFHDFEIILVDDGSKDGSNVICDEYAKKDSRIKVFHKENGGVASARQCGLNHAVGEYVIHIDPDDWIEPNMLDSLIDVAIEESSDMVICDIVAHNKNKTEVLSQKPKSLNAKDVMREFFHNLHGSCCNKLVKRGLFERFEIFFPLNMVVWEDLFVCVLLTMHDIRISYAPKVYYHYVCSANSNSLVNTVSRRKLDSMLYFINYFEKIDGFDKSLLKKRKIEAKRLVFLMHGINRKSFKEILPDVNFLFIAKFEGFKKIDSLIRFSMLYSWPLSRMILYVWKLKQLYIRCV